MRFADLLGQEGMVRLLQARLKEGTALDTNYIFSGAHGSGKCVRGDTLVPTSRGLVPIKSLMGPNKVDPLSVEVVQETGAITKTSHSYRDGVQNTICIRTHHGYELEGTDKHRIRVMAEDGTIQWRYLGDIRNGDYACIARGGIFGSGADISGFKYNRNERDQSSKDFQAPRRLNEDWGVILGFMIGDGDCLNKNGISLSCAEVEVKQEILRRIYQATGFSTHATRDRRRSTLEVLRCNSVRLLAFLRHIGVDPEYAGGKHVPWSIMASPRNVVRAFLRGYFESDGTVGKSGVEVLTKSEHLAREVQVLLLQFGIVARRFRKLHPIHGTYWRLRLKRTSVDKFFEEINFVSSRKVAELHALVTRRHARGRRAMTNTYDYVPYQNERIRAFYNALPKERRTRAISNLLRCRHEAVSCTYRQLHGLCVLFHDVPGVEHFRRIYDTNYFFDPIVSITYGRCEVYDLSVPDGEMFSANGFMNHNTTSARILAKAILCEQLEKGSPNPEPCNECDNCVTITDGASAAYTEQDAASHGTIDHIRSIVEDLPFAIMGAAKRIYCFDEMHRMSAGAQDVLLKPMEEKKLLAIMCTTESEKIRGPIRSRCEEYTIRKATREELLGRMKWVLDQEKVKHEDDAVLAVIDHAGGHVRDILNRLEMVAQIGEVSIEAVREYLNLGSVALSYEILLALTEPRQVIELVDKLLGRMSPDDVAASLAESALATFRLANGLITDLVYVDRNLAQKVYEKYGLHVLKLAEHFTRMRVGSKAMLLTEILCLSQAGGRVQEVPATVLVAAAPASIQAAPLEAPAAQPPPATPSQEALGQTKPVTAPPPAASPAKPSSKPPIVAGYANGVGPIGVDPLALGELDHMVVPVDLPRNSKVRKDTPLSFESKQESDFMHMTPGEWAALFKRFWLREVPASV
jgi:DNA polymerase III subunit gamma/tau